VSALALRRLAVWLAAVAAALLAAPRLPAADPTLHPVGEALAAGSLIGLAVFLALARRRPAIVTMLPRQRVMARSVVLAAKSAQEEALWRAFVLGALVGPLGRVGALALSSALFAGAHVPRQGRRALVHLLTGSAFGVAYLATGRLHAAIAAHGTYNVLVGTSAMTAEALSISDSSADAIGSLASGSLSRRDEPTQEPASAPREPAVARLEHVRKSFGHVTALDGVDLTLRRGEILALLGPNGAGKSTAVAILLGLRRPDAGRATLFGLDPRTPDARRRVGAVLQEIGFPPAIRVREVVDLVRAHFREPESTAAVLAKLDLEPLAGRDAVGLSAGQRRRLAVALALAARPDALFLDEPTAGMDATARRALLADIVAFTGRGGAVLLTTQQLAEAEEIASRVVLLVDGRVALEGSVSAMRMLAGLTRVTVRAEILPTLPGVASIDSLDGRHVLYVDDADRLVADLVRSGVPFSDLEVAPATLEDAFVTLTGETPA
jgi:ABC-2 type transport system ATP-binding protein